MVEDEPLIARDAAATLTAAAGLVEIVADDDVDPISAGTAGDAAQWGGSIAAVGMAAPRSEPTGRTRFRRPRGWCLPVMIEERACRSSINAAPGTPVSEIAGPCILRAPIGWPPPRAPDW